MLRVQQAMQHVQQAMLQVQQSIIQVQQAMLREINNKANLSAAELEQLAIMGGPCSLLTVVK